MKNLKIDNSLRWKLIIAGILFIAYIVFIAYPISGESKPMLGNINKTYSERTTTTSDVSFSGDVGDRIKFSFRSTIESGDLDIILYDSTGNEVYELDRVKELETFFNLSNSDTYTLVAECSDFVGKFDIKIHKWN